MHEHHFTQDKVFLNRNRNITLFPNKIERREDFTFTKSFDL